jgi:hypothetical protein
MRRPHRLAIAAVAGAWVLTLQGCGGPAHVSGVAMTAVSPAAGDSMASRFPGSASVLSGVEVARGGESWSPGDRVLLGLSFERGGAHTERMLLIELGEEPGRRARYRRNVGVFGDSVEIDSPTRATRLRVFDDRGELVSASDGQLAEIFLEHGPWEVARIGGGYAIATGGSSGAPENPRPEVTLEQLRPGVYGMMSLLAFGEGAGENAALAGLIERAFTMGQKLGLLFSMGQFEIRIGAVRPIASDAPARQGLEGLECYDCQVLVSVNGKLALSGRAVLTPSVAPLGTCGGIVLADLTNAVEPDIRVGVVLLASQRGRGRTAEEHGRIRAAD